MLTESTFVPSQFKRFLVIVLENEDADSVLADDYFFHLTSKGTYLSQFYAVTHPSQPNYIALTSGDLHGVNSDNNFNVSTSHIGDLLEGKGYSWINYAEGYPGNCYTEAVYNSYRRKHVPFMSYDNVRNNATRCSNNIVPSSQFQIDYESENLPDYIFYTPDINNDGHDTNVKYSSNWLKGFLEPKLEDEKFMNETLIVITYDEGHPTSKINQIYTVLLGHGAVPKTMDNTRYTTYDLLRLVEDNFGLDSLGLKDFEASGNLFKNYQIAPESNLKQPKPLSTSTIIIVLVCSVAFAVLVASVAFYFLRKRSRGFHLREKYQKLPPLLV